MPTVSKISISPMTSPRMMQQARLGAPLVLELAAPLQPDPVRIEMHLRGDLRLRFLEVGGEVAVAIVDADGEIALAVLARDGALARCVRERRPPAPAAPACPAGGMHGEIAERVRVRCGRPGVKRTVSG